MVTITSLRTFLLASLGSASLIHAGDIQLDGVIRDAHDNPVPGIVVSLDLLGLRDTSDAQGKWSLESTLAGLPSQSFAAKTHWSGRALSLSLKGPAQVQADAFDVRGNRIGGLSQTRLDAGNHNLTIPRTGRGIQWLRLSIDGKTQVLPMGIGLKGELGARAETSARATTESSGILAYSWQGDTICTKPLDSLHEAGIQQTLRKVHLASKSHPDQDTQVDSVVAGIDLGDGSRVKRFGLRFKIVDELISGMVHRNGYISGQLYLPVEAETVKNRKRAWINVLGKGLRRTGISDTLTFAETADTIRFDTAFYMSNALPYSTITGDSIQLVSTNHDLGVALLQPRKLAISKYEWEVDGAGLQVGGPIKTVKWSWPGRTRHMVRCRVTDVDGNVDIREKSISIWYRDTMGRVYDRTVLAGDPVVYRLVVADTNGVAMTIWNFGDGTKDTVHGGPFLAVTHAYPVIPPIGASVPKTYTLKVTKVDGKGKRDSTSAKIIVTNPLPSFGVSNTVGEVGTRLTLHLISHNEGTFAKVEWGVGSSPLVVGQADTTIELPILPDEDYLVRVRVTDERGNVSPVDTVHVRARQPVWMTDDRDGQRYRIVTIGTQTWMAQNLNYRQTIGSADTTGSCKDLNADMCSRYGRHYTWAQAMDLDSVYRNKLWPGTSTTSLQRRGICPQGWHVPSTAEWSTLVENSGGELVAGKNLKSTSGWTDDRDIDIGTDKFWFSGLPGGSLDVEWGGWGGSLARAFWWTSNQPDSINVTDIQADFRTSTIVFGTSPKINRESLRCLKD